MLAISEDGFSEDGCSGFSEDGFSEDEFPDDEFPGDELTEENFLETMRAFESYRRRKINDETLRWKSLLEADSPSQSTWAAITV